MNSVIEEIYKDISKNIDKYVDGKECAPFDEETARLLQEVKQYVPCVQEELFKQLWRSAMNGKKAYGLVQFKGGFKMGFKIALECLRG